jgi:hypothetical protein
LAIAVSTRSGTGVGPGESRRYFMAADLGQQRRAASTTLAPAVVDGAGEHRAPRCLSV